MIVTNMNKALWKTREVGMNNPAFCKDGRNLRDFTEEDILEAWPFLEQKLLIRSRAQEVWWERQLTKKNGIFKGMRKWKFSKRLLFPCD